MIKNILKKTINLYVLFGLFMCTGIVYASEPTADTFPMRGSKEAKITLMEFSDFQCPFCAKIIPTMKRLLTEYPEDLNWVFRHNPLRATPGQGAFMIHESAVCAQEQGKFWEFHDGVFQASQSRSPQTLQGVLDDIALNHQEFNDCMQREETRNAVIRDLKEGQIRGVRGTPSVFVGPYIVSGAYPYEYFKQLIDFVLNPDEVAPPDHLVEWSAVPRVVEFSDLEDRPSRGPEDAPVTIVEFSDFHCPFCKKQAPIFSELMQVYEGKIRQVWRHFPLNIHPRAGTVHMATECAHEQGRFWDFHEALMVSQRVTDNIEGLKAISKRLKLNSKKFDACMESNKHEEKIEKDIIAGRKAGVQGTPTIFINGKKVVGAYPFEHYDLLIKSELNS